MPFLFNFYKFEPKFYFFFDQKLDILYYTGKMVNLTFTISEYVSVKILSIC